MTRNLFRTAVGLDPGSHATIILTRLRPRESIWAKGRGLFYDGRNKSHDTMLRLGTLADKRKVEERGRTLIKGERECLRGEKVLQKNEENPAKMYILSWERAVFREMAFCHPLLHNTVIPGLTRDLIQHRHCERSEAISSRHEIGLWSEGGLFYGGRNKSPDTILRSHS
jgi:hypothetical protein